MGTLYCPESDTVYADWAAFQTAEAGAAGSRTLEMEGYCGNADITIDEAVWTNDLTIKAKAGCEALGRNHAEDRNGDIVLTYSHIKIICDDPTRRFLIHGIEFESLDLSEATRVTGLDPEPEWVSYCMLENSSTGAQTNGILVATGTGGRVINSVIRAGSASSLNGSDGCAHSKAPANFELDHCVFLGWAAYGVSKVRCKNSYSFGNGTKDFNALPAGSDYNACSDDSWTSANSHTLVPSDAMFVSYMYEYRTDHDSIYATAGEGGTPIGFGTDDIFDFTGLYENDFESYTDVEGMRAHFYIPSYVYLPVFLPTGGEFGGKAWSIDGEGHWIAIHHADPIDSDTAYFSVGARVKFNSFSADPQGIVGHRGQVAPTGTSQNNAGLEVNQNGDIEFIGAMGGQVGVYAANLQLATWYTIEMIYCRHATAGWIKLFVNGQELDSVTGINTLANGDRSRAYSRFGASGTAIGAPTAELVFDNVYADYSTTDTLVSRYSAGGADVDQTSSETLTLVETYSDTFEYPISTSDALTLTEQFPQSVSVGGDTEVILDNFASQTEFEEFFQVTPAFDTDNFSLTGGKDGGVAFNTTSTYESAELELTDPIDTIGYFAISSYVKVESIDAKQSIMYLKSQLNSTSKNDTNAVLFLNPDGSLEIGAEDGTVTDGVSAAGTIQLDTWYYVEFLFTRDNPNNAYAYVDGELVASAIGYDFNSGNTFAAFGWGGYGD